MDEKELKLLSEKFLKMMLVFYYEFQEYPMSKCKFKLNSLSFNILFRLYANSEGTLTILELTEKMQISKPQLIKLINNLENEHLLIRKRFKENRRIVYLSLSEDGKCYIDRILTGMEESFMDKLLLRDTPTINSFADGLQKITAAMDI